MSSKRQPRWTQERILVALHAWRREMGEPPRSYEWSPGTARSLDRYNERAAGWEREWPRWPGTDTLRYHFGRFNQALVAAGFPARPLIFELSLPERVEAARRLLAAGEAPAIGGGFTVGTALLGEYGAKPGSLGHESAIATSPSSTPRTTSVRAARVGCGYAPATFTATVFVRVYAIRASKPFSLP